MVTMITPELFDAFHDLGLFGTFATDDLPLLDQEYPQPTNQAQKMWSNNGYFMVQGMVPDALIDAYTEDWQRINADRPTGYPIETPYMHIQSVRDICCYGPIQEMMQNLIGEPMGVHLNLTPWVTTERNWHQDGYLNPDHVTDHYLAVWVALDDIHPDSGPFEFAPGSHRLPKITHDRMLASLTEKEQASPMWPKYSERILTPLFERLIVKAGMSVATYTPKRGDVLFWHARLLHRGSMANVPGMERRALIAHYSGIHHRPDMPPAVPYSDGYLFPIHQEMIAPTSNMYGL